jgi:hypothetical protein
MAVKFNVQIPFTQKLMRVPRWFWRLRNPGSVF